MAKRDTQRKMQHFEPDLFYLSSALRRLVPRALQRQFLLPETEFILFEIRIQAATVVSFGRVSRAMGAIMFVGDAEMYFRADLIANCARKKVMRDT